MLGWWFAEAGAGAISRPAPEAHDDRKRSSGVLRDSRDEPRQLSNANLESQTRAHHRVQHPTTTLQDGTVLVDVDVRDTGDDTCDVNWQRVVLLIVGTLDCAPPWSSSNLLDIVTFLEQQQLIVSIGLLVDVDSARLAYDHQVTGTNGYVNQGGNRTITSQLHRRRLASTEEDVFKRARAQLAGLRRHWGHRVWSWTVEQAPSLSVDMQARDFPQLFKYKSCSWASPLNGIPMQYKLLTLTREVVFCSSDIVIRMRPNSAVDLSTVWSSIQRDMRNDTYDAFFPPDSAGGVGINDNLGVMTVATWARYASLSC